jgi:hypothetical protein
MRRSPVVFAAFVLLLSTGLVLFGLGATLSAPELTGSAVRNATGVALGRAFYAAANTVLATGTTAQLDTLVAPNLVEHPASADGTAGRAALVRSLLARRATYPGLHIVVEDIQATGDDLITVRVHAAGATAGSFLGLSLPPDLGAWGPIEILRIDDGRIVERWSGRDAVLFQPLGQAPLAGDETGPSIRSVFVTRLTAEPGAHLTVENGAATRFLLVETGALTVEITSQRGMGTAGDGPIQPDSPGVVRSHRPAAGKLLATLSGERVKIDNDTAAPAVALVVTVFGPQSAATPDYSRALSPAAVSGAAPTPPGFTFQALAANLFAQVPGDSVLGIGWIVLAAGTALPLLVTSGAVLIAVDTGPVDVTAIGGEVHGYRIGSGPWAGHAATLQPGDGASFTSGTGGLWQTGADDPAILLVLAIAPRTAATSPVSPSREATPIAADPIAETLSD